MRLNHKDHQRIQLLLARNSWLTNYLNNFPLFYPNKLIVNFYNENNSFTFLLGNAMFLIS